LNTHKAYTDSSTITQYLEYFFPGERPLTIEDPDLDEKVKAATGGVFGAFARYVCGTDMYYGPQRVLNLTLFFLLLTAT
jgi:hypothetical protein